jgi:hypothetical protein
MVARWLLGAIPILAVACNGSEPPAAAFVGRWTAQADAPKLLKGRLSASSYVLTLRPDGTATFENVPDNLYGTPPGPLVSGTGTWSLAKSSGRTVLKGDLKVDGRARGLEFSILPGDNPKLYVDLTDPDQVERFTYAKESLGP